MSVQVRYRREAAAFLASFVGAQGELLIDTTNNRVQVHDGATPGGFPAAKLSEVVTNARTQVADASYTALATDRNIAITSLTAARTISLPAASTFPTGTQLEIFDESGACSSTNTITLARAGTDTINGAASATIQTAYGYLALECNGAGKWTIVDSPAASGGAVTSRTPVADASTTALSTDRLVAYTTLTAARTVALPAASAFPTGNQLFVVDESGACSSTNTITIARAGSDTINGATSATIASAYGYLALESNGAGKWTIVDQAVGGSLKSNFAAAADPTSTADASQGYAAGSLWLRADTGDIWRCRSATTGAAVWLRLDQADFYGYVANNWYRGAPLGTQAGITLATGRPTYFPANIKQRCTLSALEVYVSTAATGNLQIALYRSDPTGRMPTGAPLMTTASMSTAAAGNVSAAVSIQLDPGLYWFGTMADNTSAAIFSYVGTGAYLGSLIGFATESNTSSNSQFTYIISDPVTFGSWPTLSSTSFSIGVTNVAYTPAVNYRLASIP